MEVKTKTKPRYRVNLDDVPKRRARPTTTPDGEFKTTQRVYGTETSLLLADREPGYHTNPHKHDCEQMNYILSGEIWFFVEDQAYRCGKGDIMRIPRNKLHWAWVRADSNCSVIESHSPPLPGNGEARLSALSLLADDETLPDDKIAMNARVMMDPEEVRRIEERAIAEEERSRAGR
jgi:quercetin dioxygenase-like cupin family protein